MNKFIKYGVIATLSIGSLTLTSCKDALEEVVYSELVDENAFVTATDALAAVNGAYEPLLYYITRAPFSLNDVSSDVGSSISVRMIDIMNENDLNTQGEVVFPWDRLWYIISRANVGIFRIGEIAVEKFDKTGSITPEGTALKARYIAELKALRAWAYMQLNDFYFRVPLSLNAEELVSAKLPLASVEEIENQILKDLGEAYLDLPVTYTDAKKDDGRFCKGSTEGYLAKMYMRRAGRIRNSGGDATADWTAALTHLNNVINSSRGYTLVQGNIFNEMYNSKNENALYNKEAIFTIHSNPNGIQGASDIGLRFTNWSYDMGWSMYNVPYQFFWKYDPADKRAKYDPAGDIKSTEAMFVVDYQNVYNAPFEEGKKRDRAFFVTPRNNSEVGVLYRQVVINEDPLQTETYSETAEVFTQKYKYTNTSMYNYNTYNNVYALRLADIILCKAECINELSGPTSEAVGCVDQIRSRAFGDGAHGLKPDQIASKEAFRRAICDERAFELVYEGHRRSDLIRMGLWKEVMMEHFNEIKATIMAKEDNVAAKNQDKPRPDFSSEWKVYPFDLTDNDRRRYFPIPKSESDYNPEYLKNREGMQ